MGETKAIDWPEAFQDKMLDSKRERIERILTAHRPQHGLPKAAWKQIRRIAVDIRRQRNAHPEAEQGEADRWIRRLISRPQILVDG